MKKIEMFELSWIFAKEAYWLSDKHDTSET